MSKYKKVAYVAITLIVLIWMITPIIYSFFSN